VCRNKSEKRHIPPMLHIPLSFKYSTKHLDLDHILAKVKQPSKPRPNELNLTGINVELKYFYRYTSLKPNFIERTVILYHNHHHQEYVM
jgi:hypothetical protein